MKGKELPESADVGVACDEQSLTRRNSKDRNRVDMKDENLACPP
jgi:hypothetical protein